MRLEALIERLGEDWSLAWAGLLIGLAFGFLAQRSRFCLRSAVIEFSRRVTGGKLTVWLFAFATAVLATQALVLLGAFDASDARQIAARGSLSGAAIGGALFGMGMILARGCSSRLLVLAAQGNLRSLLSGLVFAVTAQAAWTGALSPLREAVSAWWTVDGGDAPRPDAAPGHRPCRRPALRRRVAGRCGALGAASAGAHLGLGRGDRRRPLHHRRLVGHLRDLQGLLRPAPDPGAELHRPVGRGADARALRHRQAGELRRRAWCPACSSAPSSRRRCSAN